MWDYVRDYPETRTYRRTTELERRISGILMRPGPLPTSTVWTAIRRTERIRSALERFGIQAKRTPSPPTLTSGIRRRAGSGNLCANEQLLGELPTFRRSPSHVISASRAILRYKKRKNGRVIRSCNAQGWRKLMVGEVKDCS